MNLKTDVTPVLPKLGDVLLLLVVGEDLPAGVPEGEGVLAVVRHSMREALSIFVGGELTRLQHAVQVGPRPEKGRKEEDGRVR